LESVRGLQQGQRKAADVAIKDAEIKMASLIGKCDAEMRGSGYSRVQS
jgi:hypothetical protein